MNYIILVACFLSIVHCSSQSLLLEGRRTPPGSNFVHFKCFTADTGAVNPEAIFLLNGYDLRRTTGDPLGDGMLVHVNMAELEGNYSCTLPFPLDNTPANNLTFTSLPEVLVQEGATARIDCPALPASDGPTVENVIWRSVANPAMVFYKASLNAAPPAFYQASLNVAPFNPADVRFGNRYSIDRQNYSLFIRNVGLRDARFQYQCLFEFEVSPPLELEMEVANAVALVILKKPEFIEPPEMRAVVDHDNVTFHCDVLSSPYPSSIDWYHGDTNINLLAGFTYKYDTTMSTESSREGAVTTRSTLTILNVAGSDSDTIRCDAVHIYDSSTDTREVTLNVLDAPEISSVLRQDLDIVLSLGMTQKLEPVALMFRYTVDDDDIYYTTSRTQYSNRNPGIQSIFLHVISIYDLPPTLYSDFTLSVALKQGELIGPYTEYGSRLSSIPYNLSPSLTSFFITLTLLCFLILTVITTCIVLPCLWLQLNMKTRTVIKNNFRVWKKVLKTLCCTSKRKRKNSEDEVMISPNGFDESSALMYVDNIKATIKFGEEDEIIKPVLESEGFLMLHEAHSVEVDEYLGPHHQNLKTTYRAWDDKRPISSASALD